MSASTGRPCLSAIAVIGVMSAGAPKMCTGMMARVRGVIAASISPGSRFRSVGRMSTNTGTAPIRTMASMVASKV